MCLFSIKGEKFKTRQLSSYMTKHKKKKKETQKQQNWSTIIKKTKSKHEENWSLSSDILQSIHVSTAEMYKRMDFLKTARENSLCISYLAKPLRIYLIYGSLLNRGIYQTVILNSK